MQNTGKVVLHQGIRVVDRGKRIDIYVPGGESMTLNSSGADLFRVLMKTLDVMDSIDEICNLYDADRKDIEEDADEFIGFMIESGVISIGKAV